MIYLAGIWLVCCAVFALAIIRIDRVDRELPGGHGVDDVVSLGHVGEDAIDVRVSLGAREHRDGN